MHWLLCIGSGNLSAWQLAKILDASLLMDCMRAICQKSLIPRTSTNLGNRMMRAWFNEWKLLVSHLQNASKTRIRSNQIIYHLDCKNLAVKPFDPSALSGGRLQITLHSSSSVNLSPISVSCRCGKSNSSKMIELPRTAGVLMSPSKNLNTTSALSSSEVSIYPSCTRPWMWFLCHRPLAWL
jgi:hypothetical protein